MSRNVGMDIDELKMNMDNGEHAQYTNKFTMKHISKFKDEDLEDLQYKYIYTTHLKRFGALNGNLFAVPFSVLFGFQLSDYCPFKVFSVGLVAS